MTSIETADTIDPPAHNLYYYRMFPDVRPPLVATQGSACFDLYAYLSTDRLITSKTQNHSVYKEYPTQEGINIHPKQIMMIPTGLKFDIPDDRVLQIYARSSLCWGYGLSLANHVGVVDSDYVEEGFLPVRNVIDQMVVIPNGTRLAQARLLKRHTYDILEINNAPEHKTERVGGFGSTGNN